MMVTMGALFGGHLGLVLSPPFLNGRAVLGEGGNSVLGLLDFCVSGPLVQLVAFRVPVLVNPVLPRLRVGFAPPRDIRVLQSESDRVSTREDHAEADGAKKRH